MLQNAGAKLQLSHKENLCEDIGLLSDPELNW